MIVGGNRELDQDIDFTFDIALGEPDVSRVSRSSKRWFS
jgi:hypothetical protein